MTIVCLVDDDDLLRGAVAAELRQRGYAVAEAADARTCLALALSLEPDVAIIDLLMPVKDGLELIEEFRSALPQMKLIAISTGGRVGVDLCLEAASAFGAHATLPKPLDFRRLCQTIDDLAHRDRPVCVNGV